MASNFDFLKKVDEKLYSIVIDGEKLFRDEYFSQSVVQFRIYAEKMAKSILNSDNKELTLDTVLNNLKDKIKTQKEKEFIDDLFFIKQQGNRCAHGEDITALECLEVIKRAFEAGINYAYSKKKDEKINKLLFDETLLVTQKKSNEVKLIDKYLKAAGIANEVLSKEQTKESILNQKQGEFLSLVDKSTDENNLKDESRVSNTIQYKEKPKKGRKKKVLSEKQIKIKEKIKSTKKNLKETINKKEKPEKKVKPSKKSKKTKNRQNKTLNAVLFILFTLCAVFFLAKMIFVF